MEMLNKICQDENIKLIGFTSEIAEMLIGNKSTIGEGQAVAQGANKCILFDSTAQKWEKRFTVAHEIAHHLFGHLRPGTTITHQDRENEANIFASVIVALLIFQEYDNVNKMDLCTALNMPLADKGNKCIKGACIMNRNTNNITLSKKEYNLLIAYRNADINFKTAVNRLLQLQDKVMPFSQVKECIQ